MIDNQQRERFDVRLMTLGVVDVNFNHEYRILFRAKLLYPLATSSGMVNYYADYPVQSRERSDIHKM